MRWIPLATLLERTGKDLYCLRFNSRLRNAYTPEIQVPRLQEAVLSEIEYGYGKLTASDYEMGSCYLDGY